MMNVLISVLAAIVIKRIIVTCAYNESWDCQI